MMIRYFLHLLKNYGLTVALGVFVFQNASALDLVQKYKDYSAVVTNLQYNYTIDVRGDSLLVLQTNERDVQLLNENSKAHTKDVIYFSGFTTISDKEAYTLVPNGKGYDKIKVEQFQEASNSDRSIFYDDSKTLQFAYPSVKKGAVTHLKYTINYKNPRFLRSSFFQSYIPVEKVKVVAKVHRDVKLGYKLFNTEGKEIKFTQYKKGKYNYFEWEMKDVKPFQYGVGNNYSISHYSPHVSFYIKSTNINGVKESYFGTPELLYNYYYDFVCDVNKETSEALKQTVETITKGLADADKARAIYYWVHKNIKYVAYEHGYSGFIPSSASDVVQKRFGDCKGMSSLIKTMMDIAGLPTYYAWVGTRSIPYTYEELPLPSVDNHMVAARVVNDSLTILDGTFKYLDYGVFPYHIQGKEVMVGKGKNDFQLFKIPISPASYSVVTDSVSVEMIDGKVMGDALVTYTGFNKVELAYTMDGVKPEKYDKTFSRIFSKGNNKFKVTAQHSKDLFTYEVPAKVQYNFEISDYYKNVGDEIYLNLNLDKSYQNMTIDTTGTIYPMQNDFYCTEKFVTKLRIPEGYEVTYIPKNGSFKSENFGYTIQYKQEGDYVILEKELVFNFFVLLDDQIYVWNKMVKSLNRNYRKTLVLRKKS